MKTNTSARKNNKILLLCLAVLLCAIVVDVIVQGRTPAAGVANETAQVVETGSSVIVRTAFV